jgi:hypothetical protein
MPAPGGYPILAPVTPAPVDYSTPASAPPAPGEYPTLAPVTPAPGEYPTLAPAPITPAPGYYSTPAPGEYPSPAPTELPPCPKCEYKDCYDKVEKAHIVDSKKWDTVRDAWLKATDDWKGTQISDCEKFWGIGSVMSDACALGINTIADAQDLNTWTTYYATQSLLRSVRNSALSDCDKIYYECVKNRAALIAAKRCK